MIALCFSLEEEAEGVFYFIGKRRIYMKELEKTYDPAAIEDRLYEKWLNGKYFHAEVNRSKKPFPL